MAIPRWEKYGNELESNKRIRYIFRVLFVLHVSLALFTRYTYKALRVRANSRRRIGSTPDLVLANCASGGLLTRGGDFLSD